MSGHRTFHVLDALEASPARTRRIWSKAAKDLILAEANLPGANVSAVARANDVSVHQLFRWQREAQKGAMSATQKTPSEPPLAFIAMAPGKYLNNIVEQEQGHRAIKRVARPARGFKSFRSAAAMLAGVELMRMIRKG